MKNKIMSILFAVILLSVSALCWFKPHTVYSEAERRLLAEKPALTMEALLTGDFMKAFEAASADQFPFRDSFRTVKALFATYALQKTENNGLYVADDHISKIEYPLNPQMVDNAENKLKFIYDSYLKGKNTNVYLSIIPDKNYFLAEKNGYPSIDYVSLINDFKNRMGDMRYIDILPFLSIDDYYKTDSHWKQECILDVAEHLGREMGANVKTEYTAQTLKKPFRGVYLGQSALPINPDTIQYLTSEAISSSVVRYFDTGKPVEGPLYNMEKGNGKDPYELFLSGTSALIEIENKNATTDKELIIFRDSFGSSLAPLLIEGYKKITVVDIRYIQSNFLCAFIKFENQDVLFIYSTSILNNSMSFR